MSKLKKNLATKMSKSKTGKSIIKKNLGVEGENLIKAVFDLLCKMHNEKKAKIWEKHVNKFFFKFYLLRKEPQIQVLSEGDSVHYIEEVSKIGILILEMYTMPLSEQLKIKMTENISAFYEDLERLIKIVSKAVVDKMTQKNVKLLEETILVIGKEEMEEIFLEHKYEEEVKSVAKYVKEIDDRTGFGSNIVMRPKIGEDLSTDPFVRCSEAVKLLLKKIEKTKGNLKLGPKIITKMAEIDPELVKKLKIDVSDEAEMEKRGKKLYKELHAFVMALGNKEARLSKQEELKKQFGEEFGDVPVAEAFALFRKALHEAINDLLRKNFKSFEKKRVEMIISKIDEELKE